MGLGLFCNFTISAKLFVVADDGCLVIWHSSRFVWMRPCIVIEFIALDISSLLQIQSKCDRMCVARGDAGKSLWLRRE
jgi:hypothetical protein